MWLTGQCQTEPQDFLARQILDGDVFVDEVQHVPLRPGDWNLDETKFSRPVVFFVRVKSHKIVRLRDAAVRQGTLQRLHIGYGGAAFGLNLFRSNLPGFWIGVSALL